MGIDFVTQSDTEVLVHGYEEWGDGLVEHLDGMFAFADLGRRRASGCSSARDRFGKKPLYVRRQIGGVAFGSDARSVFLVIGRAARDREEHVGEYLFQRYVVSPRTLFAGVERLAPAHARDVRPHTLRDVARYWQLDAPVAGRSDRERGTARACCEVPPSDGS